MSTRPTRLLPLFLIAGTAAGGVAHLLGAPRAGEVIPDWIEGHGLPGRAPRRGQILEVLGRTGHEHYRVRWDEQHQSLFFPTDGTRVLQRGFPHAAGGSAPMARPRTGRTVAGVPIQPEEAHVSDDPRGRGRP
jgi:Domain of unknown function (DUF1918)